jgi:hypothetical protein
MGIMEYLIGSLSTFILLRLMSIKMLKNKNNKKISLSYCQSHIFEIVKPLLPPIKKPEITTQSRVYEAKSSVKVIIMQEQAFWIKDNVFYTANMNEGYVDKETTRRVDTMGMDKVELDKMLFIMDQLRDGKINDSGSSGN